MAFSLLVRFTLLILFHACILLVVFHTCIGTSASLLLKGSVTCINCSPHYNFSGIVVAVKCDHQKKLFPAITNYKGYFQLEVDNKTSSSDICKAKLLGGPKQLCALKKYMSSKLIKHGQNSYGLETPLMLMFHCPSKFGVQQRPTDLISTERTADAQARSPTRVPGITPPATFFDFGLPLIFFFPFLPIIGIP